MSFVGSLILIGSLVAVVAATFGMGARGTMRRGLGIAGVLGMVLSVGLFGFYTIQTGNVGVEKTLGSVNMTEIEQGLHWRFWPTTDVREYSAKVVTVDLNNMTPKAADNLSLDQLDVTVFYRVAREKIAELATEYASTSELGEEAWYPGYHLLYREARGAVYESVAEIDSLELHRNREVLSADVQRRLHERMEEKQAGVFVIDRIVIRALDTDDSVEKAIREKVENEKKLEAKSIEVDIAKKEAEIRIEEARGIAESNRIINESLTPEYLQHEVNKALQTFADGENNTVVIPANMQGFEMILDSQSMNASK